MSKVKDIFARMLAPRKGRDLDRRMWYSYYGYGNDAVSPLYYPEEAMKVAAAWRCVSIISGSLAAMPWRVMQNDDTGAKESMNHPLMDILSIAPNPEMTASAFRETLISHVLLYGNGYAEIVRDGMGMPKQLYPIAADRVEPKRNDSGDLIYRVMQDDGGQIDMLPSSVFHVPGLSWDGIRGYSVLDIAGRMLKTAMQIDSWTGNYFKDGMNPPGVVKLPEDMKITPDTFENIRKGFDKVVGRNAHHPFIAAQGMDYKAVAHTPEQAQFLETRLFMVREVARVFGVPPYMLYASDAEPRANVEQQNREFVQHTLLPLGTKFEQEANRKLIMYPRTYHTSLDYMSYLRGDMAARINYLKEMRNMGVMSVNEIRLHEGMAGIGEEGEHRVMQVQYQPIDATTGSPGVPPELMPGESGQSGEAVPMPDFEMKYKLHKVSEVTNGTH